MKKVIFTDNVDYGGIIRKGTVGILNDDENILSIPVTDYDGPHLLGSSEARFEYPIPFELGFGDIMSKIKVLEN